MRDPSERNAKALSLGVDALVDSVRVDPADTTASRPSLVIDEPRLRALLFAVLAEVRDA
jgi:hypothetical protein